jgi:hypothetical protein
MPTCRTIIAVIDHPDYIDDGATPERLYRNAGAP